MARMHCFQWKHSTKLILKECVDKSKNDQVRVARKHPYVKVLEQIFQDLRRIEGLVFMEKDFQCVCKCILKCSAL